MTTALTLVDEQPAFSNKQLELIKTTIAPGVDDNQLALFIEVAKRTGLDPFSKQIYAILRNAKEKHEDGTWHTVKRMTIQTGIDGYRAIAARTGYLAGIDDAQYDTDEGDYPRRATVTVWRLVSGQRCAFTATARWREYAVYQDEYKDGKKTGKKTLSDMWERMPYLMLGKCAEALALRKAFPNEISGVYTAEEMAQADTPVVDAITEAAPSTARQLGEYATKHGIAPRMIQAGLRKYGGDIERTYEAMRTFVQNRDAAKKPAKPAPVLDDDSITFEVEDTRDHSLEGLEVAGKN